MNKSRIIELTQELASVPDTDTGYAKHYILEDIENELNEKLEDKNMRILKGYRKAEQKELEEAKDNGFNNAICLINGIISSENDCICLAGRYEDESSDEDNLLARDIADYYAGVAKFPEQKYYIKLPKIEFQYLVQDNDYIDLDRYRNSGYKEEFTEQEIKDIDPRYMAFAIPVSEVNE